MWPVPWAVAWLLVSGAGAESSTTLVPLSGRLLPWDPRNVPGQGWPGQTPAASNAAWPTGSQPELFSAFPHDGDHAAPCWKTQVLDDVAQGWPGMCQDVARTSAATEADCEATCKNDPTCSVWQWLSSQECFHGPGLDCKSPYSRRLQLPQQPPVGPTVVRAQRVMHGSVRVLKNMKGWQVEGLRSIGVYAGATEKQAEDHCRAVCSSRIVCQYWQLGADGECFVEDPKEGMMGFVHKFTAQYPLTTDGGATASSAFSRSMLAGEYIQHVCPPHSPRQPLSATASDDDSPGGLQLPVLFIAGGVGLVLLCGVGGCLAAQALDSAPGRKPTSRALDMARREESAQPLNDSDSDWPSEVATNDVEMGHRVKPAPAGGPTLPPTMLPALATGNYGAGMAALSFPGANAASPNPASFPGSPAYAPLAGASPLTTGVSHVTVSTPASSFVAAAQPAMLPGMPAPRPM